VVKPAEGGRWRERKSLYTLRLGKSLASSAFSALAGQSIAGTLQFCRPRTVFAAAQTQVMP